MWKGDCDVIGGGEVLWARARGRWRGGGGTNRHGHAGAKRIMARKVLSSKQRCREVTAHEKGMCTIRIVAKIVKVAFNDHCRFSAPVR